eukprot:9776293-Alexandrium_andersonii.AAC.1
MVLHWLSIVPCQEPQRPFAMKMLGFGVVVIRTPGLEAPENSARGAYSCYCLAQACRSVR